AEQIGSAFAEAEGTAEGDPELCAGKAVNVAFAGYPFDGRYTLTSTRHVFDDHGYRTHFVVSGRQERTLLSLASPRSTPRPPTARSRARARASTRRWSGSSPTRRTRTGSGA